MSKKLLQVLISVICVSLSLSCNKDKDNSRPQPPTDLVAEFRVEFDITEGIITSKEVILEPKAILKVISTDDAENYKISYSVDGTEKGDITGLWNGKTRDISKDIRVEYGEHVIEGCIYPYSDESKKQSFKQSVWVRYQQITVDSMSFSQGWNTIPVETNAIELPASTGTFNLFFSPSASRAEISVSSSDTGVLTFDEASIKDGQFSVEFYTGEEIGESSEIVVSIKNGESVKESRFTVTLTKPLETLEISVTGPEEIPQLVYRKKGYPLVINLIEGTIKAYRISYYFDGSTLEEENETVQFDETRTYQKLLPAPSTSASTFKHTIKVVVIALDNPSLTAEDTIEFKISTRS